MLNDDHSRESAGYRRDDRAMETALARSYNRTFFAEIGLASMGSARVIVPLLLELVHPESVVDVGCGTGAWLAVCKELGVSRVTGLDGDYVDRHALLIKDSEFVPTDLRRPWAIDETFDLALCLEVAEHLPKRSARQLVDSLCHLAPAICFSAAVPGQGGLEHQNERWFAYWEDLFKTAGFTALDPVRPQIWQDRRVAWYYRQNCFVFVRSDTLDTHEGYRSLADLHAADDMILLHDHVLAGHLSFWSSLRRLPPLFVSAVARILGSLQRKAGNA